jgi:hypothetical protein
MICFGEGTEDREYPGDERSKNSKYRRQNDPTG